MILLRKVENPWPLTDFDGVYEDYLTPWHEKGFLKKVLKVLSCSITPFPCPFSVLAIALFIYYTVPTGTEARKKYNTVNKKECGLTRKGHGDG